MRTAGAQPRVSVAIPTYNSSEWVGDAIESVLAQSVSDLEVVVVDDASDDETVQVVDAIDDPRIHLYRNAANLGHSGNWNHTVSLCRAPYVKFLCADDLLREDSIEQMLPLIERSERVGLVFSRRRFLFPAADPEGQLFHDVYSAMHERFGPLQDVNSGRALFATWARAGFDDNWIGEPSNVMMRRSLFLRLGGLHPCIHQASDMELWIRAMFHGDVGFVDEPLATYRIRTDASLTVTNFRDDRLWLDRLWIYDALLRDREIRRAHPELRRQAWLEGLRCCRRLVRATLRRPDALPQRMHELRRLRRQRPRRDRAVAVRL